MGNHQFRAPGHASTHLRHSRQILVDRLQSFPWQWIWWMCENMFKTCPRIFYNNIKLHFLLVSWLLMVLLLLLFLLLSILLLLNYYTYCHYYNNYYCHNCYSFRGLLTQPCFAANQTQSELLCQGKQTVFLSIYISMDMLQFGWFPWNSSWTRDVSKISAVQPPAHHRRVQQGLRFSGATGESLSL